jgi:very-short-patch-repair endonuclease
LIDLAGAGLDLRRLDRALDDALRKHLTTLRHLSWAIQRLLAMGHRGPPRMGRLLDERDPEGPSASTFQKKVRRLLRAHGDVEEEHVIRDLRGRFIARVDFAEVGRRVVVEAEGAGTHSGRDDWWHDLRRRNKVTALGWQVLHVVPEDVDQPAEFLKQLRVTLDAGQLHEERAPRTFS